MCIGVRKKKYTSEFCLNLPKGPKVTPVNFASIALRSHRAQKYISEFCCNLRVGPKGPKVTKIACMRQRNNVPISNRLEIGTLSHASDLWLFLGPLGPQGEEVGVKLTGVLLGPLGS